MYGYELAYEPATEGIGSWFKDFFAKVARKIKDFGSWIKDTMRKIGLWIRRATNTQSKSETMKDASRARTIINSLDASINGILTACIEATRELVDAFSDVAGYKVVSDDEYEKYKEAQVKRYDSNTASSRAALRANYRVIDEPNKNDDGDDDGWKDYSAAAGKGGMRVIDKDATKAQLDKWKSARAKAMDKLAPQAGNAEEIRSKLQELTSLGALPLQATKDAYKTLSDIFSSNGKFGNQWNTVKTMHEWATDEVKSALGKIVSVYDMGVRATTSFGNRLVSGKFRNDDGSKLKTDTRRQSDGSTNAANTKNLRARTSAEFGLRNQSYANNSSRLNSANNTLDRAAVLSGHSTARMERQQANAYKNASPANSSVGAELLDDIYQIAYEDAMNDIAHQQYVQEAYDAIPEYEFDAYDDFIYDPDYDLV